MRPDPLAPIANRLEHAISEPVRFCGSVPPQTGKTVLIAHAFVKYMLHYPMRSHMYVTYQQTRADEVSLQIRNLAQAAGLRPDGTRELWRIPEGGQLRAGGFDTGLTGTPATGLVVVDDPHKNRQEAESLLMRDRVYNEFNASVMTRIHATTSIFLIHARWHPNDLIGRHPQWPYENLPAINDAGESIWPALKPLSLLYEARDRNAYDWWSLYQGKPRPPGGRVFRDVQFYDELPKTYRVGVGVDLAYTKKKASDYCAIVVMAESEGKFYVLDVRHEQSTPPEFAHHFKQVRAAWPGAQWLWYTSSTEIGLADTLRVLAGFPIRGEIASEDKFVRAQPFASAWNGAQPMTGSEGKIVMAGTPPRVFIPRDRPWVAAYVSELADFTGVNDKRDDQVDASVGAYDVLAKGIVQVPRAFATSFTKHGGGPVFPSAGSGNGGWTW